MTREQTYSQLLSAVGENERKSDKLRNDHEMLASKLHELQMEHDDSNDQFGKKRTDDDKPYSPEIEALDKKIAEQTKEKEIADELCRKVNLVYDQVRGWCTKVIQKIDQQFGENISAHVGKKTLAYLFEAIADAVCKQLETLKVEEDEEDRGFITAKDFMNDFAT